MSDSRDKIVTALLSGILFAWFIGHLIGETLFDNDWSFSFLGAGTLFGWVIQLVIAISISYLLLCHGKTVNRLSDSRKYIYSGLGSIFLLTIILQFDSILFGGGTLRVAQISQAPILLFKWYEFGTVVIAGSLYKFFSLFMSNTNDAAGLAWRVLAYGSTIASLIAVAKISARLSDNAKERIYLFLIIFFGPQTILYFGFVGVEPLIVALTLWVAFYIIKIRDERTIFNIVMLWLLAIFATTMHFTGAYLVPAVLYVTFVKPESNRISKVLWASISGGLIVLMIYIAYQYMNESLLFRQLLMPLEGRHPNTDYSLMSMRHISDVFQIFWLLAPIGIMAKFVSWFMKKQNSPNYLMIPIFLMATAGSVVVVILNPVQSVILEFPRYAAYLTPFALFFATGLIGMAVSSESRLRILEVAAAFSILLPLLYMPAVIDTTRASEIAVSYFDKHEAFNLNGRIALRDASFYNKEFDEASAWEVSLMAKSVDYLEFRGCVDLTVAGRDNEALTELRRLIVRNPDWIDPRDVVATVLLRRGQYELAKPQIDTSLLLNELGWQARINLSDYYHQAGQTAKSLISIEEALEIWPMDVEFMREQMLMVYRLKLYDQADSISNAMIAINADLPHPYLVKAYLAEINKDFVEAINQYERFMVLDPKNPTVNSVLERVSQIKKTIGT